MKTVTIVGGGASGTLVAVNLARLASKENRVKINLIEASKYLCRGVAYSSDKPFHLLNVPAGKISAFPDTPDDFVRWLAENGNPAAQPEAFAPRRIYGDYLVDRFRQACENNPDASIQVIDGTAKDIEIGCKVELTLNSGQIIASDTLVLAFGNFLPPHPSLPDREFIDSPGYVRNIWKTDWIDRLHPDYTVVILGTGLSMVDATLTLKHANHRGKIKAISTRGLLPAVHSTSSAISGTFVSDIIACRTVCQLLRRVRKEIKLQEAEGGNWRSVIDSLRPITQTVWQNLPAREKRRFAVHLSRWWNAARHRMPPSVAEEIQNLRSTGQLEVLAGRIREIRPADRGFNIRLGRIGGDLEMRADMIINCIASESNFRRVESPFLQNLFNRGYVRSGPLGFGFDALPNGAILDKNGVCGNRLFTLGTALKGVLWETTAIPEIREQAANLARLILSEI